MAKFFVILLIALLAISMLQVTVYANGGNRGRFGPGSLTTSRKVPGAMHKEMQQNAVPQAVHVLLPKVLREMPMRATWVLWEQTSVPVLQQLEDQGRWTKMSLDFI
ncbi:hypothetical protein QVD17_06638 [Tagetes erecta]|uniref:Uncharacterized protein n=1 Tax=Tagetes erecta TaxID=13708 RepID=A0AAD8PCD4_TARER|nr:hypothetical protein QVD17_06638 [Tagetes erecta]